jgi:4-carboxymuconolactone decarboxylase
LAARRSETAGTVGHGKARSGARHYTEICFKVAVYQNLRYERGEPGPPLRGEQVANTEGQQAAWAMRRAILGDAYVDAAIADTDPIALEFQEYLTSMAWGVWARGGALTRRDRSLLVMAMTAALGRVEEFALHVKSSPRAGVTDDEVDELLFQIVAYCGVPAGVAARRAVRALRADRAEGSA